nr:RNA-directed DNA polymerase, eukaryota, reverse transcriptase zinc-binding domain protein [Tanacetum cinerariifolium]
MALQTAVKQCGVDDGRRGLMETGEKMAEKAEESGQKGDGGKFNTRKKGSVMDKGSWVNDIWCWERDWVRNIRGRVNREFEDLLGVVQNIVVHSNCRDKWRWTLDKNGEFMVKELARLVEEKILHTESGGHETLWNILVPKKVNIFVWRATKERLPVRVELDKKAVTFTTSKSNSHTGSCLPHAQTSIHGVVGPDPSALGPPSGYRSTGKCEHSVKKAKHEDTKADP